MWQAGDTTVGRRALALPFVPCDIWTDVHKADRQRYLLNAYRVLLTRARQGMIIFVPPDDQSDPTRLPRLKYYERARAVSNLCCSNRKSPKRSPIASRLTRRWGCFCAWPAREEILHRRTKRPSVRFASKRPAGESLAGERPRGSSGMSSRVSF